MAERPWWRAIADRETIIEEMDDEENAAAMEAYFGLLQGDFVPLAAFLRTGYRLNHILRRELVHAITGEGEPAFRLEPIKTRRGPGNPMSAARTGLRDLQIGFYIKENLPSLNGKTEAAFAAAAAHFDLDRSVIVAAWSKFKKSEWFLLGNKAK